jgi:hypothetical protein
LCEEFPSISRRLCAVTPTLIVSRIIKSALKLILDTLILQYNYVIKTQIQQPRSYDTIFFIEVCGTSLHIQPQYYMC